MIRPTLKHARTLHEAGFKLCKLHPGTKQPFGDGWNKNFVEVFDESASGYGFPLAANGRCSIDPDNLQGSRRGVKALLGVELDHLMAAGARTRSTREGSGGRAMFKDPGGLAWIRFRTKESGVLLELRADSPNLQDVVPGLVYLDKEGNECTQTYDDPECTYLDAPKLPQVLLDWWMRLSVDQEYLHQQQVAFAHALGETPMVTQGGGKGKALPNKPSRGGLRSWFNGNHDVADILVRHDYSFDGERYAPPSASALPGVRRVPSDGNHSGELWHSDHASDPLSGSFDAWSAFVVLDHDGDLEAAEAAVAEEFEEYRLDGFPDYEAEREDAIEGDWLGIYDPAVNEDLKPASTGPHFLSNDRIPQDMDEAVRYFNRIYFMIAESDVTICRWAEGPHGREIVYQKEGAFISTHKHVRRAVEDADGKTKLKPVALQWLTYEKKTSYYQVIMDPKKPIEGTGEDGVLNLWKGWAVKASPAQSGRVEKGLRAVLDHIREVLADGDEECNTFILDWIARMFQHPADPAGVALVFRSDQGTGKSVIGRFLAEIAGNHGLHTSRSADLVGKFNGILEGKVFVFADEAMFAGNPANNGPMKALITERTCTIERKGMEPLTRPQSIHLMMATNEDWAVHVEGSDRRYAVFQAADDMVGDPAYFNRLWGAVEDREVQAAFLHEMERRAVSRRCGPIPQTQARVEQKVHGLRGVSAFVRHLVNVVEGWKEDGAEAGGGDFPVGDDGEPEVVAHESGFIITKSQMWRMYEDWYENPSNRHERGHGMVARNARKGPSFAKALEDLGITQTQSRAVGKKRGWLIDDTDELMDRLVR